MTIKRLASLTSTSKVKLEKLLDLFWRTGLAAPLEPRKEDRAKARGWSYADHPTRRPHRFRLASQVRTREQLLALVAKAERIERLRASGDPADAVVKVTIDGQEHDARVQVRPGKAPTAFVPSPAAAYGGAFELELPVCFAADLAAMCTAPPPVASLLGKKKP